MSRPCAAGGKNGNDERPRPWATWRKGDKPITPRGLAKLLEPLSIYRNQFKLDGERVRGYRRDAFDDAIARYRSCSRRRAAALAH